MRKENGPAVADEFMEVNLAMCGLGGEVGGLGAKTETGLHGGELGGIGKTTDGGERDWAEFERSAHGWFAAASYTRPQELSVHVHVVGVGWLVICLLVFGLPQYLSYSADLLVTSIYRRLPGRSSPTSCAVFEKISQLTSQLQRFP